MMPSSLVFCCLCSCPCLLPSGYLWSQLVLLSRSVSCSSCKPVCQYSGVTRYILEEFGYGELWHRVSSRVQMETRRILSWTVPQFLCPDGSGQVHLGQAFEKKWWSYLCSQVYKHSWETRSLSLNGIWVWCTETGDQLWAQVKPEAVVFSSDIYKIVFIYFTF